MFVVCWDLLSLKLVRNNDKALRFHTHIKRFGCEGDYMLTITKREQVGSIQDKAIYRVGAFQILPLAENLAGLNEEQVHFMYFTLESVMDTDKWGD